MKKDTPNFLTGMQEIVKKLGVKVFPRAAYPDLVLSEKYFQFINFFFNSAIPKIKHIKKFFQD